MTLTEYFHALLDCAVEELGDDAPDSVFIAPGNEVAWDNRCGQLWVRLVTEFPSETFPGKTTALVPCPYPDAYAVELGILRCVTGIERLDEGGYPTPEELTGDAEQAILDKDALRQAIECCVPEVQKMIDLWRPQGPAGGVVAGVWSFWLDGQTLKETELV